MYKENQIFSQALEIKDEIIKLRAFLHSHPELSFEEHETAKFISDYLSDLGLEVKTGIAKTGVTAILRGALDGDTIGLRADMDALPIGNNMHACGHDGHMAILLGAAKLLTNNKSILKGVIKFIFQPAEENSKGAQKMIEEGVLSDPDIDKILGLHILPDIKSGCIEINKGPILASTDEFKIIINGKGGHGSNPQNTIDPIMTGALLVTALQTIISRKTDPNKSAVISVCEFNAGTKSNIIPENAYLSGTIRCNDEKLRNHIFIEIDKITKAVCQITGAQCNVKINDLVPVTVNDAELFDDFMSSIKDLLEEDEIRILDRPYMYGEDFSYFGKKIPALFFLLGTYNESKGCIHPPHSEKFKMDEDILPLGAAIFANYCLNRK